MKIDDKVWTPNHDDQCSSRLMEHTLCETQSVAFAVQSAPDRTNTSDKLLRRQRYYSIYPEYCAKDTLVTFELFGGYIVTIDIDDLALIAAHKWRAVPSKYTHYVHSSTGLILARLLLGLDKGDSREGEHKDGNGLNNRRDNLRVASRSINLQNRRKFGISNDTRKSQFLGVQRSENGQRWLAKIYYDKGQLRLGTFDTEIEAAAAYDRKALELYGPEARLNLPCPTTHESSNC